MIRIDDKSKCMGCCACADVCGHNAISMQTDIEGFRYPKVDTEKCIECGLCEKICPELHIETLKTNDYEKPSHTFAAFNKRMEIRLDSTSGGTFSALAETMYEQGGYVSGAVYNADFSVSNYISDNPDDLPRLRSSKYLQSKADGLYRQIRTLLRKGKKVMACGTPCQMTALRSFLGKSYDNLIIVDFICRGVNSPKAYRKYLDSLEEKFGGKAVSIKTRNKELGWRSLTRKITFDNGRTYYGVAMDDDFERGYHTNVYCRPACYSCKYKGVPRISDITIADFWGIDKQKEICRDMDNDTGTSLIFLNSKKGEEFFASAKERLEFAETDFHSATENNPAFFKPLDLPKIDRRQFFNDLDHNGFDYVRDKYFPDNRNLPTFKANLKQKIRPFYHLYKIFGKSPRAYFNFCKVNFRRNTNSDLRKGNVIYTMPGSELNINQSAKIDIRYPLCFGKSDSQTNSDTSCLRMTAGTSFEIHGRFRPRYGNMPYELYAGASITIINSGRLSIGQGIADRGLKISCAKKIDIGNGVIIGKNVAIFDHDTDNNAEPVIIEDEVWIGAESTIMPGTTIGKGTIIEPGAVVSGNISPHSTVKANRNKTIKS